MSLDVEEAIFTARATRRLRPEPVSERDLRFLVEAAVQAPSAENRQPWAFVVVTDPEVRARLGAIQARLGRRHIAGGALARGGLAPDEERVYRSALRLTERLAEAPALVVACMRGRPPADPARAAAWWGSIFPAVQNLLLAARARGLGATLTTLHKAAEVEVKAVLGLPDDVETVALVPVGRPAGRFGRPRRRPAEAVTHWNRWGGRAP